jgi:hypothetical protein
MKNRFTVVGAAALVAALAVFGMGLSGGSIAQAGNTPCNSTPTPPVGNIQELQAISTCTAIPNIVRSATPTSSPTSAATNIPVPSATSAPATVAPASTPVPATATSPAGGQLGAVSGPNTGTGDGTAAGGFPWIVLAGMAFAVAGVGSIGYGLRKRS